MSASGGPRIAPLPVDDFPDEVREALRAGIFADTFDLYFSGGPDARPMPNIVATLAHHPSAAAGWLPFHVVLLRGGSIDPRIRELAVLRTCYRVQAQYQWTEHVRMAKRLEVTDEQVAAIADGSSWPHWSDHERDVLEAVDELLDRH